MSQTPTEPLLTNASIFDMDAVPTDTMLTAVSSFSACSADQPPSQEIFEREVSEKGQQQAPCSPSPRGIETWGPCSPFNLPNPSTALTLVEPTEISRILDDALSDSDNLEFSTTRKSEQDLLPLISIVDSQFIQGGSSEEFKEHTADGSGGAKTTNGLDGVNDFEFSSNIGLHKECHPAPMEVYSEHEARVAKDSFMFPQWTNDKSGDGNTDGCGEDECISVVMGHGDLSVDEQNASSILSQKRTLETVQAEAVTRTRCYDAERCYNSRGSETVEDCSMKKLRYSLGMDGNGEKWQDGSKQEGQGQGSVKLTEEELKRIRRVKNRASVEKCRAKQRMRMEALQCELKVLKYENQTLRDLTTWMDSSVNDISSQMTELGYHKRDSCGSHTRRS